MAKKPAFLFTGKEGKKEEKAEKKVGKAAYKAGEKAEMSLPATKFRKGGKVC